MRVGIVGTTQVGRVLAFRLARVGHEVLLADLDGVRALGDLPERVGATGTTLDDAAAFAQVAVLASYDGRPGVPPDSGSTGTSGGVKPSTCP